MDNPSNDIAYALARLITPSSVDSQTHTVRKYFYSDASLSHPLCYIESAPNSYERIIRAFAFLSVVAPGMKATIRRQSFNDIKGKMVLDLEVTPSVRGIDWVKTKLGRHEEWLSFPVHVFVHLRREQELVGPWRVGGLEILCQPMDILLALHLGWLGRLFYFYTWILLTLILLFGQTIHIWSNKEFSIRKELHTVIKDGLHILGLQPYRAGLTTAVWTRIKVIKVAWWVWAKSRYLQRAVRDSSRSLVR